MDTGREEEAFDPLFTYREGEKGDDSRDLEIFETSEGEESVGETVTEEASVPLAKATVVEAPPAGHAVETKVAIVEAPLAESAIGIEAAAAEAPPAGPDAEVATTEGAPSETAPMR